MAGRTWIIAVTGVLLVSCSAGADSWDIPRPSGTSAAMHASEQPTVAAVVATTPAKVRPRPLRRRVEHRFSLPSPDWLGAADGSLWVKRDDGRLSRIDPSDNRILTSIRTQPRGAQRCQGLGVSDRSVWACAGGSDVVHIDPSNNRRVARIAVGKVFDQGTIPVVADHAWVLVGDGSTLAGVSLQTNEVEVEIALDTRCVEVTAEGEEALWLACLSDDQVVRVDLATRQVTDRVTGLEQPRWLSVAGAVWVLYADGLARVDLETRAVAGALDIDVDDGAVHASGDAVWVRARGTFLQRVDPETMELQEVLTAPEQSAGSVLEAFGSLWATANDDTVMYRLSPGP